MTLRRRGRSLIQSTNVCQSFVRGQAPGWGLQWAHWMWRFPHGPHCLGRVRGHTVQSLSTCHVPGPAPSSRGHKGNRQGPRSTGPCSALCSVTRGATEGTPGCCGHSEGLSGPTQPRAVREGFPGPSLPRENRESRLHEDGLGGARKTTPRRGRAAQESRAFRGGRCPGHCCRL